MVLHQNPYLDTEFQVLNCISKISTDEEYFVFKSGLFPNYYDGNKFWFTKKTDLPVKDLRSFFKDVFPSETYSHVRFVFEKSNLRSIVKSRALKGEFKSFERNVFMSIDHCQPFTPISGYLIRELRGEKDWEEFYYHQKACHPDNDWYLKEGLDIQKIITEKLGIQWFGVFEENNPKILSSLGIFKNGHLARLQDVKTNPGYFRKGLATYLMVFVIQYALMSLKAKELVLCADKDYHAFKFYKKLGFTPKVEIMVFSD
ncbi:MAG: GNAT family N-acetyltransferase [Bacteroidota bacterium]